MVLQPLLGPDLYGLAACVQRMPLPHCTCRGAGVFKVSFDFALAAYALILLIFGTGHWVGRGMLRAGCGW